MSTAPVVFVRIKFGSHVSLNFFLALNLAVRKVDDHSDYFACLITDECDASRVTWDEECIGTLWKQFRGCVLFSLLREQLVSPSGHEVNHACGVFISPHKGAVGGGIDLGDSRIVKNLHLHCIAHGPLLLALEGVEVSKRLRVCGIAPALGLVYAVVKERQIALDLAVEAGKNPLAL